jgi:rhamnulokinase
LAAAYASTAETVATLTGHEVGVVHMLGGGSRNDLLCQLTADALDRPVLAGPAEATALGNVLVQARARGALPKDLDALRQELAHHEDLVRYRPQTTGPRSNRT